MNKGSKIKQHVGYKNEIERMIIRENELKREKMQDGTKVVEKQFIKINEPEVFEIINFLDFDSANMDYGSLAVNKFLWKGNDIVIYKHSDELQAVLDKYGIHYTVFESFDELKKYLTTLLPERIRKRIQ